MFNGYHIYVSSLGFITNMGDYTKDISSAWFCNKLKDAENAAGNLSNFFEKTLEINVDIKVIQIAVHNL